MKTRSSENVTRAREWAKRGGRLPEQKSNGQAVVTRHFSWVSYHKIKASDSIFEEKTTKMSITRGFFERRDFIYPPGNCTELYASSNESLPGANRHAGHYLCLEVDPAPATPACEAQQQLGGYAATGRIVAGSRCRLVVQCTTYFIIV